MQGGIDEAGRGPVIGPLVVAGVAVPDTEVLVEMGVRDSKKVPPPKRERMARLIRALPGVIIEVRVIEAPVLDAEMARASLNEVEARRFADIAAHLAKAGATRIVADAADVDAARFGRRIGRDVTATPAGAPVEVLAEHGADDRWPCTAAASIIAKTTRDAAIATLARRLERTLGRPLGSGYPSDPLTQAFMAAWHEERGGLPEGTRRTWKTARDLVAPRQAVLGGVGGAPAQRRA